MRWTPLALVVVLAACPRPPLRFGPNGEVHDPQVLLASLKARSSSLHALIGGGNLQVKTPRGGGNAGVNVAAERPASLRVEVLGFFDNPVLLLATDGQRLSVYHSDDATFAEGLATPRALSHVVPVALGAEDLVSLLFGVPPLGEGSPIALRVDPERRAYALTIASGERQEVVYQDLESLLPVAFVLDGPEGFQAQFEDYRSVGEGMLPRRILLASNDGKSELRLTYRKVRLEATAEPSLFQFAPPKGAHVIPLDAE
jgi:hypothetical protein